MIDNRKDLILYLTISYIQHMHMVHVGAYSTLMCGFDFFRLIREYSTSRKFNFFKKHFDIRFSYLNQPLELVVM